MIKTSQKTLDHWEMQLNYHIGPNWKDNYPKYNKLSFTRKFELTDKILKDYRHSSKHNTIVDLVSKQIDF